MGNLEKFWGWGSPEKSIALKDFPDFFRFLKQTFSIEEKSFLVPKAKAIHLPPSVLSLERLSQFQNIVGKDRIKNDHLTRLCHSFGKSTLDLIKIRFSQVKAAPDAVCFVKSSEEVLKVLELCQREKIALVPFGGGSSVLGGVAPLKHESHRAVITLNLQYMNEMLELDSVSHTARFEAGILGPDLERKLNERGYTLGHFPQSFEFSTLGGWVATRSSGQFSTTYGNIENMVLALKVVTCQGVIETKTVPRTATGPDLHHLWMGSEGVLGVISEVVVRIRPIQKTLYAAYYLKDFKTGVELLKTLKQQRLTSLVARLSDIQETDFLFKLQKKPFSFWKKLILSLGLKFKSMKFEESSFLLLGFYGALEEIKHQKKYVDGLLKKTGKSFYLGQKPGLQWEKNRFTHPYLRDCLLDYKICSDTFETAATWNHLMPLYEAMMKEVKSVLKEGFIFCHVSHVYETGASLYFTFLLPFENEEVFEKWKQVKEKSLEVILKMGATPSHHHGIGLDHRDAFKKFYGRIWVDILRKFKKDLDPNTVLNPSKLIE